MQLAGIAMGGNIENCMSGATAYLRDVLTPW